MNSIREKIKGIIDQLIIGDFSLKDIDPDDLVDTLVHLQSSFGVKFGYDAFKDVKTFGELCDIIESKIDFNHDERCTTQQAFYKIRKAIILTSNIHPGDIRPQSKLADIFPRQNRRQMVSGFQQALGLKTDILLMKLWLLQIVIFGFIISLVTFFWSWKYGISGLTFFILFSFIADKFSKELGTLTVGELSLQIYREHYQKARRDQQTVNKKEIVKLIQDVFMHEYGFERSELTRAANIG